MLKIVLFFGGILVSCFVFGQSKPDSNYFNEIPPDISPKVFAPGKISKENEFEFGAVFSNDRSEFYYGVEIAGKAETRMMKFENGSWSPAVKILSHELYSYNDPFLTPDNKKLFFISDRPLSGSGPKKDYDIWYMNAKPALGLNQRTQVEISTRTRMNIIFHLRKQVKCISRLTNRTRME